MKHRLFLFLSILLLGAGSWTLVTWRKIPTGPISPPSLRAPYDPALTQKNIEFWAGRARRDPQGLVEYSILAGCYLKKYRESGDIGDALRAEAAARRSLSILSRNNSSALDELAASLLAQHRFAEALQTTQRSLALSADDPQAVNLCAEAYTELGNYTAAESILRRVASRPHDPGGEAMRARLLEIEGKPAVALDKYYQAQAMVDRDIEMPADIVAWFHMRVGNCLAAMGRDRDAERSYHEALDLFPHDYRTMTSLAKLEGGRGNWKGAIEWGQKSAAIVPTPEVVALVGDAYKALSNPEEAAHEYQLVDAIAKLAKAQGVIYDRQRALFDADHRCHLEEALTLARQELKSRKDIYAYDTLAWVCCQKRLLSEASAAIEHALAQGTQDALLFYHAGMIAYARGDRSHAISYLQRALAINPYFHPTGPGRCRELLAQLQYHSLYGQFHAIKARAH